jgi:thiol-disulfide isomerase/thioredoxin
MTHVRLASFAAVAALVLSAGSPIAASAAPRQATSPAAGPQGGSTAPAAQARQAPAYQKPLADAGKITDPEKKIEAYRKVIADFPNTPGADQAEQQILSTLVGLGASAAPRIEEQAQRLVASAPAASKPGTLRLVANSLVGGGVLLESAEQYAKESVDLLVEASYLDARKKEAADRAAQAAERAKAGGANIRTPPPYDEQAARSRFKSERQAALVTYAQALDKRAKQAEAEKVFGDAFLLAPKSAAGATSAVKLAEYAKKAGRDQAQFDYLSAAALSGRLAAPDRAEMEAVYRKMHGGALTGLDELLDARYEQANPNPVEVKPYEPAPNRSDRIVLAEVFTGSGCGPCVGADLAFEAAMERYPRQDLAVIMYHLHVPRPDPMTNPWTLAREKYYKIRGVPTYFIDGETDGAGGGDSEAAPKIYNDRVVPKVESHLARKAEARLTLQASMANTIVKVHAQVDSPAPEAKNLRLQIALVEEQIRYSGENGVRFHPMVVRSLASKSVPPTKAAATRPAESGPDGDTARPASDGSGPPDAAALLGFVVKPASPLKVDYQFDVAKIVSEAKAHLDDFEQTSERFGKFQFMEKKYAVDPAKLAVVAFIQDEDSKKILQAAYFDLDAKPSPAGRR